MTEPGPDDQRLTSPSDSQEEARAIGAAAAVHGFTGAFAWMNRSNAKRASAAVSPMTWSGFVAVTAWVVALCAIVLVGRALWPGLGSGWTLIGLAVMVPVAMLWRRRATRR